MFVLEEGSMGCMSHKAKRILHLLTHNHVTVRGMGLTGILPKTKRKCRERLKGSVVPKAQTCWKGYHVHLPPSVT